MKLVKSVKAQLSKVKFALGYNPVIKKSKYPDHYIPAGYKAVLTITADFELAWAPRYSRHFADSLQASLELARQERANVPKILAVCDQYNIPITWATVGHLFLSSCQAVHGKKHPEIPKVPPYNGQFWSFHKEDWFEYDPCSNLEEAPEWYAPDLIQQIINAKTPHEIGCHTFSHIDCRDSVCPTEVFESELLRCKELAAAQSLELTSFVHPGHTIGHLRSLEKMGFTSFQTKPANILGSPIRHGRTLWELQRTMEWVYRTDWSTNYLVQRYKTIIDRAIATHTVCNFWFHPSFSTNFITKVLPELLAYINQNRDKIWVSTAGTYTHWLNQQAPPPEMDVVNDSNILISV